MFDLRRDVVTSVLKKKTPMAIYGKPIVIFYNNFIRLYEQMKLSSFPVLENVSFIQALSAQKYTFLLFIGLMKSKFVM